MGKYVFIYKGGKSPENEAEGNAVAEQWGAWMQGLGNAVADMGNPFGGSATVAPGGATGAGASGLGGYTIVTASSLDDAVGKADGCPIFTAGGDVEVYEAMEM